jgi:hypothetical protein
LVSWQVRVLIEGEPLLLKVGGLQFLPLRHVFLGAFGEGVEVHRRELKQVTKDVPARTAFVEKEAQLISVWPAMFENLMDNLD